MEAMEEMEGTFMSVYASLSPFHHLLHPAASQGLIEHDDIF